MPPGQNANEASRNRRLVSQLLVAALFAVAYSEAVGPVTHAFNESGVNLQSLAWMFVYMATVLRFFIGNILHLESPDLIGPQGAFRWFFDLIFIVMQCAVLIFAGAVTTIHSSAAAEVSFTDYLLILYGLDLIWLLSMRFLDALGRSWPRTFGSMVRGRDMAPIAWAVANVILGLTIWGLDLAGHHPSSISDLDLVVFLAANVGVFVFDVMKIAYGIRDPKRAGTNRPTPVHREVRSTGLVGKIRGLLTRKESSSGMELALTCARRSLAEGGIPIGAALLDRNGRIVALGHNRRVQKGNPVLHAEIDCLANLSAHPDYTGATLFSTLMPCNMCAEAIIQARIPCVVVGESRNFSGARGLLARHEVQVVDLNDSVCREMLESFITENPQTWREDIGE